VLAGGAVIHAVVELEIAIKLNRDLNYIDGERANLVVAGEAGAFLGLRMRTAGNAFVLLLISHYPSLVDITLTWKPDLVRDKRPSRLENSSLQVQPDHLNPL
jgi:hypothetical protein